MKIAWQLNKVFESKGRGLHCFAGSVVTTAARVALVLATLASSEVWAAVSSAQPGKDSEVVSEVVIVFIGDSLTQGYGVESQFAFPEILGERLVAKGYKVRVINAGVSGSVTAEADQRLRWQLRAKPDILVLALGANDGLKGTPASVVEANLRKALRLAVDKGVFILFSGMKMMTNLGSAYVQAFDGLFPRLFKEVAQNAGLKVGNSGVAILFDPFLLEGVALQPKFNTADGRHPNAAGHSLIANRLLPQLELLVNRRLKQRAASATTSAQKGTP